MRSLIVKKSAKDGGGVFTTKEFKVNDVLWKMEGQVKHFENIEYGSYEDKYCLQITKKTYLVSSAPSDDKFDVGDFFNHSCDPNAGIKKIGKEIVLVAIKNIDVGAEVTFDYAVWTDEEKWELECHCGSSLCRSIVKSFKYLPKDLKEYYISLGVVPEYILKGLK